ncbi:MAG: HAD-IA family hydrolase [Pseudomonadota bacterium]
MNSTPLRLVIFDVDGTLVDSQAFIVEAMHGACRVAGVSLLAKEEILSIVGLSLPEAMAVLFPELPVDQQTRMVELYKQSFLEMRRSMGGEAAAPLYPGALEALHDLDARGYLLSIATGKARRGLDHMLDSHGLRRFFLGTQTADDAPSKPNPQMVLHCLAATGAEAVDTVVVGDTEFDLQMARAAGCHAIGVAWGYHPIERLQRADPHAIIDSFDALIPQIEAIWEVA